MDRDLQRENDLYGFFKGLDRSLFLDNEYKAFAHYDNPFPIGFEQTISQPTLVYDMTALLELYKDSKVLEIGTGSGYQTAFLAQFAGEVCTVERIGELSRKAKERLGKLGYTNIKFKVGNGTDGWAEYAPYDRIIVTAAAGKIPEPLLEQLDTGGRMLVPVGEKGMQELMLISKDNDGAIGKRSLGKVTFVELRGEYGWKK